MAGGVVITGAAGMLGRDVVQSAAGGGLEVLALGRSELDITDRGAVQAALAEAAPDAVINCAAWTDVDGAESAPEAASEVNGAAAGNVAGAAAALGAWTVHISSDYVFDGTKRSPYLESDPPSPLSAYGRSKLAGEHAVARSAPGRHTIVRSSWLFGSGGPCFPATILRLAAERETLSVVEDQIGCPTFTGHLARALIDIVSGDPPVGVVHLAGGGHCSWYEFASEIVSAAGLSCEVQAVPTTEMPRPATR